MKNRTVTLILIFLLGFILSPLRARAESGIFKKDMHFTDTLHTQRKIDQFLKAVEIAPHTWVYKEMIWKDESTVTVKRMKFNESMVKTLQSELVSSDEGLRKRITRLHKLTKPMNATLDLTISYKKLPDGLAISYDIANMKMGGGRKEED